MRTPQPVTAARALIQAAVAQLASGPFELPDLTPSVIGLLTDADVVLANCDQIQDRAGSLPVHAQHEGDAPLVAVVEGTTVATHDKRLTDTDSHEALFSPILLPHHHLDPL